MRHSIVSAFPELVQIEPSQQNNENIVWLSVTLIKYSNVATPENKE